MQRLVDRMKDARSWENNENGELDEILDLPKRDDCHGHCLVRGVGAWERGDRAGRTTDPDPYGGSNGNCDAQ
jgi:hypothetical protein